MKFEDENTDKKAVMRKVLKIFLSFLALVLIILSFLYWYTFARQIPLDKRFDKKTQTYAFVMPTIKSIKGIGGYTAETCKACHTKVYDEWKKTTHASALADIQFQGELAKESSPKWLCLNCHIPVQNQREYIIKDLKAGFRGGNVFLPVKKANPKFSPKMQKEAITCAACHVRTKGTTGEGYIIGPYGSTKAPHPVKKDKQFLQNICLRCHNPIGEAVTENLICWFDTKNELARGQSELVRTTGSKQSCVSCHMPREKRRLVHSMKDLEERDGTKHNWVGSGVPKWFKDYDTLIDRGYESALGVNVKEIVYKENKVNVRIILSNDKAGHYLPTADPERFILILVKLKDKHGKLVSKTSYKIGQGWKWSPARKVSDNRLFQGEKREWKSSLSLDTEPDKHKIIVSAIHVKVTSKNAKYLIKTKGINEDYFPKGQHFVSNAINYYPMASFVYKEDIDLETKQSKKVYSPRELIELSKKEKGKALKDREY